MGFTNFPNGVTSFGIPVYGDGGMSAVGGNTYWVKKSTDTDYQRFFRMHNVVYPDSGYNAVQTTVAGAFAAALKNDRIVIMAPDSGGHDLTGTITISQFGLKVYGMSNSPYLQRTMIKLPTTATDVNMFIIKADKVEIAGLTLQNRKAGVCVQIGDAAGQAYYQTYIHDCNMTDYGGVATYGITPGAIAGADTDQCDTVNLTVENCYFDGFVTAAIKSNGTRDAYVNNYIKVPSAGNGIHIFKHTDSRGGGLYKGNFMLGAGNSMGILVTDVGSTACANNIVDNYFVGFGTALTQPITQQTNLQGGGNMYAAAANGTWTAIDIVA